MGDLRVVIIYIQIIMFIDSPKRNNRNKLPHFVLAIIIRDSYGILFVRSMCQDLISYFVIFILY